LTGSQLLQGKLLLSRLKLGFWFVVPVLCREDYMIYKTVSPSKLQPGDLVRRLGKFFTVGRVSPASELGSYNITFLDGSETRLTGAVTIIDKEHLRPAVVRPLLDRDY
jgi:hypothetical protein